MIRVLLFVAGTATLSGVCAAQQQSTIETSVTHTSVPSLVESWGGGKEVNATWTLNSHWVGMLNEVIRLRGYEEGGHLESAEKSKPVRFNVLKESFRSGGRSEENIALVAMGKRGFSMCAIYRETLPTLDDLRNQEKLSTILGEFGEQHGRTDSWAFNNHWHWSEEWNWFTLEKNGQVRVLFVFAHVSQIRDEVQNGAKAIDHLVVREGFFRLSNPANANDQKQFPSPTIEEDDRQKRIDEKDMKQPDPLRSLLLAKHTQHDSELKEYFAAIRAFREQPNAELLKQLVANMDEGTCEIKVITSDLFRSQFFDEAIGVWNRSKHKEACVHLINALPSANSPESMMNALVIVLAETGIEKLEMSREGIEISMKSPSGKNGAYSFSRFHIQQTDMAKVGEILRDYLLSRME